MYVFIQHTNNKTGFSQTTSLVYQFSVVWSVSQFIERDCFIRQRVVDIRRTTRRGSTQRCNCCHFFDQLFQHTFPAFVRKRLKQPVCFTLFIHYQPFNVYLYFALEAAQQ